MAAKKVDTTKVGMIELATRILAEQSKLDEDIVAKKPTESQAKEIIRAATMKLIRTVEQIPSIYEEMAWDGFNRENLEQARAKARRTS